MTFWESIKFWFAKGIAEVLGGLCVVAVIIAIALLITWWDGRDRK